MNREVFKDADHLCKGLAEWITSLIEETLTRKEQFWTGSFRWQYTEKTK